MYRHGEVEPLGMISRYPVVVGSTRCLGGENREWREILDILYVREKRVDQVRNGTIMFADISGSTKLYDTVGDAKALALIGQCMAAMKEAVETNGGRVVKTIGDEIMAVFAFPDAAVFAASQMNFTIDQIPVENGQKLGIRVGFQHGPVIQKENDVFGDTVNMAARLVKLAAKDQIITSKATADMLSAVFGAFKRPLYATHVKGKEDEVDLCELLWRRDDTQNQTVSVGERTSIRIKAYVLRLKYRETEVVRRREGDTVTIGREASNGIVVESTKASRNHCVIERRGDKFYIVDQSTNGTYVTPEGGAEVELRREELLLSAHGWISTGCPRDEAAENSLIEYFVG
jgi:adenylate cyclase